MNENIAKQMLCPLCSQKPAYGLEWKYLDEDVHKIRGCHYTSGKTWSPLPGHPEYETHLKWLKLLEGYST